MTSSWAKCFRLHCWFNRISIGLATLEFSMHMMQKKDTFECRCNAVRYNIILHTLLQWLTQNIYFSFNSQKTSHSSPVRQDMGCLLWVLTLPIVRILEKIDRVITVPRCNYHLEMSFPCGDHVVVMLSVRHAATFDKFGHLTWNNPSSCRVFPPKFLT